jgi:hypothetical protein
VRISQGYIATSEKGRDKVYERYKHNVELIVGGSLCMDAGFVILRLVLIQKTRIRLLHTKGTAVTSLVSSLMLATMPKLAVRTSILSGLPSRPTSKPESILYRYLPKNSSHNKIQVHVLRLQLGPLRSMKKGRK